MSRPILADVQGLRGLAVLLVVLFHAGVPGFGGGYVGVDVFFVISGYLITGLLVTERELSGRIGFIEFYARRARRLLPAAMVTIAVTVVWLTWALAPFEQRALLRSALAATLYFSNIWYAVRSSDYLAGAADHDPFLHTWSLSVEEQFYFVWPALVMFSTLGANGVRIRDRVQLTLSLLGAASLAACIAVTALNQPWAFFAMPFRAWEFALGGLLAVGLPEQRGLRAGLRHLGWVGTLLIVWATVLFDRQTRFPGAAALVPALGTCALLVAGRAVRAGAATTALSRQPLRWLGDISYSLYLWHWPALLVAATASRGTRTWLMTATALAVAAAIADLSYRFLEAPIRRSPWLTRRSAASLAGAAMLTVVSAGAWQVLSARAALSMQSAEQRAYSFAADDIPVVYQAGCHATFDQQSADGCEFGARDAQRTVLLFGDSHAAQWFPGLEAAAQALSMRLISLTKSACPSIPIPVWLEARNRRYFECDAWRFSVFDRVAATKPALVVVANASTYRRVDEGDRPHALDAASWQAGQAELVRRFRSMNVPVLLVRDSPRPGFSVPACLARAARSGAVTPGACDFPRLSADVLGIEIARSEDALAAAPGVSVADFTEAICPERQCVPERDGLVLYRDDHHLTARFARELAPRLARAITDAVRPTAGSQSQERSPAASRTSAR